jgi:hypothetical protein
MIAPGMETPSEEPVRDHALRIAFGPADPVPPRPPEHSKTVGELLAGGRYRLRHEVGRGAGLPARGRAASALRPA